ncbi:MAG TPA: cysteine--tRNA ligase [Candidatus Omnitrophota bacterium]|nr:cysteine--tRNA ligase [Candidatus Omnitrophota bacterium]HPS37538.1 cysteine--tRNA ligase [Candidatus Omnitrophota bacterium]
MIRFHNTLSGKAEEFRPLKAGEVTFYTCGPTVYNYAHIGNFRTFAFEDLLRRFLEFKGFSVNHVMNITDVDDKTIAGANREKKTLQEYTVFYTQAFLDDMKALYMLPPKIQPNATDSIPDMIEMIAKLVAKGIAYAAEGSVYFRVAGFPEYGKLSKKKLESNIVGARVDVDEYDKEEGADFVLWKAAKEGEPSWDSPWGKGRPGWHIECSAMCTRHLGETIDIHAGGEDLVFPHHENEIAQSEAATGKPFVKYWLHAKHLLVNGEKMSKSKGNFFTLRDLLAKGYDPMAIRYALISVHYRHSLNFTLDGLKEAREVIEKLDNCYFQCLSRLQLDGQKGEAGFELKVCDSVLAEMEKFLAEDLNVAGALASFQEAVTHINANLPKIPEKGFGKCVEFFRKTDRLLGLDIASADLIPGEVKSALGQYFEARKVKDFSRSDALRKEIEKLGWLVKDGRPGEPSTVKKIRRIWDVKK